MAHRDQQILLTKRINGLVRKTEGHEVFINLMGLIITAANLLHHCFKNSAELTYWEYHNENQKFKSLKCYTEKTNLTKLNTNSLLKLSANQNKKELL